jgi:hypothetical protein
MPTCEDDLSKLVPSILFLSLDFPHLSFLPTTTGLPRIRPTALTDLITSSLGSTRLTSGSSSQSNLFPQIDRDNVHALNLEQDRSSGASTDAKSVIKDWEERDDEAIWIESGVDDQVSPQSFPFDNEVEKEG